MKKQSQFSSTVVSLKLSCFKSQSLVLIGMLFLFLIFPACSSIRIQINHLNQKPSVLPRDLISPTEDSDIIKETTCIITVNDDGGVFLVGKDQVPREQITERVLRNLRDKTPDKRIVYLEVAENVQYRTVASLLNLIRKAEIDKIGLVVIKKNNEKPGAKPTRFEVRLPSEPDESVVLQPKPNRLTLVVEIQKTGTLLLNKEEIGQVSQTTTLTDKLTQIFKERENNGVFRPGSNEVETTIFVKGPLSIKYGDVVKVIDAVKLAGANPIGLQIDDLNE